MDGGGGGGERDGDELRQRCGLSSCLLYVYIYVLYRDGLYYIFSYACYCYAPTYVAYTQYLYLYLSGVPR